MKRIYMLGQRGTGIRGCFIFRENLTATVEIQAALIMLTS